MHLFLCVIFRKMLCLGFPENSRESSFGEISLSGSTPEGMEEQNRNLGSPINGCVIELTTNF